MIYKNTFLIIAVFLATHSLAQDTTLKRKVTIVQDTTVNIDFDTSYSEKACTEDFFSAGEKVVDINKIFLVTKAKKTLSLGNFIKGLAMFPDHVLSDLDNDGKKELLVMDFTGGAHCCDEVFVFRNIAPNKYQYVAKLFAGNVCINDKKEFIYDFYEQFGYFFTCYACAYEDSSEEAPIPVTDVRLKYVKGKLSVVPGDRELRSRIRDNLAKLGEQHYDRLEDEVAQDNGLRKEFALNLAVFHYSFGRNIAETKKLFDQYYKYPDAKKVWSEFVNTLNFIKRQSDF